MFIEGKNLVKKYGKGEARCSRSIIPSLESRRARSL